MSFKMDKASTLLIRIEDYTCTFCFILFPCSCTWFISTQNMEQSPMPLIRRTG